MVESDLGIIMSVNNGISKYQYMVQLTTRVCGTADLEFFILLFSIRNFRIVRCTTCSFSDYARTRYGTFSDAGLVSCLYDVV